VGRAAVQLASQFGHQVTAFARGTSGLADLSPSISLFAGDATNPADVAQAASGQDAILCNLGPDSRSPTDLNEMAARNVVAAMGEHKISRLIFLSNFGVLGETSLHPLTGLLTIIVRAAIKNTLIDHRAALEILRGSNLEWTAVRPMRLTNDPHTGLYRVSADGLPSGGTKIARADVADFMLGQLGRAEFVRKVPAIAY
jgi:uncharacterized protein YbjT (DUF2867 family)